MRGYGIDIENGLPEDTDDGDIVVPETQSPLDETALNIFMDRMAAFQRTDPWDTEIYVHALDICNNLLVHDQ